MNRSFFIFFAIALAIFFAGFFILKKHKAEESPAGHARLVQAITISRSGTQNIVFLTGEVRAENEAGLGFRVDGKMISRPASLGDIIRTGQVVAYLDPQDMKNNLVAAKADLAAAQAELTEASSNERRQRSLYEQGVAPQTRFEEAQRTLGVASAKVQAAKAHAELAEDQLKYTELKSDIDGAVTTTLAEAGEVVRAGQVILRVAQDGGRDAVFNVPEDLMRSGDTRKEKLKIDVALSNKPDVHVEGYIREISPQADPVTRTFIVKVGLINPPPEIRLGSIVTGRAEIAEKAAVIRIPAMALNRQTGEPAVWIIDGTGKAVLQRITIGKYDQDDVIVKDGLKEGDIVITAGVHSLHPGQIVRAQLSNPEGIEPAEGTGQ